MVATSQKPHTGIIEKTVIDALDEYDSRVQQTLTGLRKLIMGNVLRAKQVVNERQRTNGQNTVTITAPQSRGTEIITNIIINVDPTVGGTMVLTLGDFVLNYQTLPPDGIEEIDQITLRLNPNDPRNVVVTPSSGTCKFLNLYLQGWEVGDAGGIN